MDSYRRSARIVVGNRLGRSADLDHSWLPRFNSLEVIDDEGHLSVRHDVLVFLRPAHVEATDLERAGRFVEREADRVVLERSVGPQGRKAAETLTLEVLDLGIGELGHAILPFALFSVSPYGWPVDPGANSPLRFHRWG